MIGDKRQRNSDSPTLDALTPLDEPGIKRQRKSPSETPQSFTMIGACSPGGFNDGDNYDVHFHSFFLDGFLFSMTVGNVILALKLTFDKYGGGVGVVKDWDGRNIIILELLYATCDGVRFNPDTDSGNPFMRCNIDMETVNVKLNEGDTKSLLFIDICDYNHVRFGYEDEEDEEVESAAVYFLGRNILTSVTDQFAEMMKDEKKRIDKEILDLENLTNASIAFEKKCC